MARISTTKNPPGGASPTGPNPNPNSTTDTGGNRQGGSRTKGNGAQANNNASLEPDRSEASRFLTLLDPTATYFTFQTFDDDIERREERKLKLAETNKQRRAKGLKPLRLKDPFARILHGTLDKRWKELCELNAQRAGIYVTVNETDGHGRSTENIKRVRALFNDLDGAPLEPLLKSRQPPHLVVESSPGKFHAYRFVTGINLEQFEGLQKNLAAEFSSDPGVCDLPRVLRLPGFIHQKDKSKPFLSHIVSTHDAPAYSGDDFVTPSKRSHHGKFADQRYANSEWQHLNSLALANLVAWVPELFPTATPYHGDGFRVSSADLGRENEEDISFTHDGIKDFGVHDLDDPREGKRTPIDIVMEWVFKASPEELAERGYSEAFGKAVTWLSERLPELPDSTDRDAPKPEMPEREWPVLDPAALYGLTGEVVEVIGPHTESDMVALVMQFHIAFGNAIGRGAYYQVEGTPHYTNLYGVLVGQSGKSRKGTSGDRIQQLMSTALALVNGTWSDTPKSWVTKCIQSGLSSGEGVVWHIRDEVSEINDDGEKEIKQQGVDDKRMLLDEREFAQCLAVMKRDGSTASIVVRKGWDSKPLGNLSKNNPAKCDEPHISICGHITADELRSLLDHTSMASGYANRFLFGCVKRSKFLPLGGDLEPGALDALAKKVMAAFDKAYKVGKRFDWDAKARALWIKVYPELSEGMPGLLGAICGRAEAQAVRLALIYAVLDGSGGVIKVEHLKAALALWKYYEASVLYIFGDSLGDPIADTILAALRANSDGLTRTQIRDLFGRNQSSSKIDTALGLLVKRGMVASKLQPSDGKRGRPTEVWVIKS
jgi:Protein of unknown function (DUF3987)/RepB DNA-primase from phage plasmid